MRVGEDAKRLHAVDLVGDRKSVEAKKRVVYISLSLFRHEWRPSRGV